MGIVRCPVTSKKILVKDIGSKELDMYELEEIMLDYNHNEGEIERDEDENEN